MDVHLYLKVGCVSLLLPGLAGLHLQRFRRDGLHQVEIFLPLSLPYGLVLLDLLGQTSAVLHQQRSPLFLPQRLLALSLTPRPPPGIAAESVASRHQLLLVSFCRGSCPNAIQIVHPSKKIETKGKNLK